MRLTRPRETEASFMRAVCELAVLGGWRVYHGYLSIRSAPGWPDLVLVKRGQPVIYAELKRDGKQPTPAQQAWLEALQAATGGAQSAGSVLVVGAHAAVVLVYRARVGGGPWEDRRDRIALTWTQPHGGGQRPWFLCPACARRVALLYSAGTGFACRHCVQRPYGSQCETPHDRSLRKVRKIRTRLGVSESLLKSITAWDKPKGMHWRTFERLQEQEQDAQAVMWYQVHTWSTRLLRELGDASAEGGEGIAGALAQETGAPPQNGTVP